MTATIIALTVDELPSLLTDPHANADLIPEPVNYDPENLWIRVDVDYFDRLRTELESVDNHLSWLEHDSNRRSMESECSLGAARTSIRGLLALVR